MSKVAIVLKGYPRLSETFIAQELLELQRRGLDFTIVSLRHPTDRATHPVHDEITAPVSYLPEYLHREPARVLRGWSAARRLPGYAAARQVWLADLRRDTTRNRVRRFGQAMVLAAELAPETERLYAHFLHTPASVARYAAIMRGLPWSCSAHAKDIWTSPEWELREKLADLDWLVTCTATNAAHLRGLAEEPDRVSLVYHGLDLDRFPSPEARKQAAGGPVRILSVGRAVAKKGYDDLLNALARLAPDLDWRFEHIGGGKELGRLKAQAASLGIAGRIDWRGAQPQAAVLDALGRADIFVLASRIAGDGDRDGLPNVLMEAQSQRVACVSTSVSAIPELIRDGETGLLVPERDPSSLARALEKLARDPECRDRLAAAGEKRVRSDFAMQSAIGDLARRFGLDAAARPADKVA
jgi:glycosyltransferase involved in cell wall biosynthesis